MVQELSMDTVCVTGASGYVGTALIKELLERGYHVKGTVRSTSDPKKHQHLIKLADALPGNLELFEADLLEEGSFDDAIAGCKYVFHVASPFIGMNVPVTDVQKQLVDPALEGTKNVFSSIVRHKNTVKRVVLTASIVSMYNAFKKPQPKNGVAYSDQDWNETDTADDAAYNYSKTVAEKAAWELAKENGIELNTIHPGMVLGPPQSTRVDGESVLYLKTIMEGNFDKAFELWYSDVRDVALAHVRAAESRLSGQRYVVFHENTNDVPEVTRMLREAFPQWQFKEGKAMRDPNNKMFPADNSKLTKELGIMLTPIEKTVTEMARVLVSLGIVQPKPAQHAS